jgi:hypothetical protein
VISKRYHLYIKEKGAFAMSQIHKTEEKNYIYEEITPKVHSGMAMLLLNLALMAGAVVSFIMGLVMIEGSRYSGLGVLMVIVGILYFLIIGPSCLLA